MPNRAERLALAYLKSLDDALGFPVLYFGSIEGGDHDGAPRTHVHLVLGGLDYETAMSLTRSLWCHGDFRIEAFSSDSGLAYVAKDLPASSIPLIPRDRSHRIHLLRRREALLRKRAASVLRSGTRARSTTEV